MSKIGRLVDLGWGRIRPACFLFAARLRQLSAQLLLGIIHPRASLDCLGRYTLSSGETTSEGETENLPGIKEDGGKRRVNKQRGRGTSSRAAYPPLHPIVWGCQGLGEVTSSDKLRQAATSYDVATTWLPRDKSSATCSCWALWNLLFHLFCVKPCLISHTQDLQLLLFISPHILSVHHLHPSKLLFDFPSLLDWWPLDDWIACRIRSTLEAQCVSRSTENIATCCCCVNSILK